MMVPVCDAVASAHRAGVLHRDLKPSNVMLARGEGAEVPKVVDFGIARMLDATEGLTESGALVGTRGYLAPELLRDGAKAASEASDVYALGVIAHECLTGRRASDADEVALGEGTPEVAEALRRCLARAPDGRHASAWELARALLPHVGAAVRARWVAIEAGLEATESSRVRGAERRGRIGALFAGLIAVVGLVWWMRSPGVGSRDPSQRPDASVGVTGEVLPMFPVLPAPAERLVDARVVQGPTVESERPDAGQRPVMGRRFQQKIPPAPRRAEDRRGAPTQGRDPDAPLPPLPDA